MLNKPTSQQIFNINSEQDFRDMALQVFHYQVSNNSVYSEFVKHLNVNVFEVKELKDIPFLPINFFKTHKVLSGDSNSEIVFTSSGTTSSAQSQHFVNDVSIYKESYSKAFQQFYGQIKECCILTLLPNYLERDGSSLIYMVNDLIAKSNHPNSGFFLYNTNQLLEILKKCKLQKQKTLLIGVTYALLDFAEKHQINFAELIVMETGGMKGKRKEIIREELHQILQNGFGVPSIHSEYGMTELLSQAYSTGNGIFACPPWMRVLTRDTNDPLSFVQAGKTGGINVIDLANINSCSFIATQDLGKTHGLNSFEVLGRFDNSDVRGCNLMME